MIRAPSGSSGRPDGDILIRAHAVKDGTYARIRRISRSLQCHSRISRPHLKVLTLQWPVRSTGVDTHTLKSEAAGKLWSTC